MNNPPVDLIQTLATVLPIIAASLVIVLVVAHLAVKIRKKFNVNVNCWFCNQWTKVPYENRNCFNCPTCLQYNGFDEVGDYNKEIPAQHDEFLNKRSPLVTKKNHRPTSNGFCRLCNNNQQLKIYQLANFVPLNEENFDVEIEHFSKQLENAYKLCSECDHKLKQTLLSQHKWILGLKIRQLKQQGLDTLRSLQRSSTHLRDKVAQQCNSSGMFTFLNVLVISFTFLVLANALYSAGIFDKTIMVFVNESYEFLKTHLIRTLNEVRSFPIYWSNLKTEYDNFLHIGTDYIRGFFDKFLSMDRFSNFASGDVPKTVNPFNVNHLTLSICGLFLQIIVSTVTTRKRLRYAPLALWSLLIILSWCNYGNGIVLFSTQVFATLIILYTIFTEKSSDHATIETPINTIWNNVSTLQHMLLQEELDKDDAINASFQSNYFNKEDTAESDCSFESITSKTTMHTYLSAQNTFNNTHNSRKIKRRPACRNQSRSSPLVFKSQITPPNEFSKMRMPSALEISPPRKFGVEQYLNNSMDNLRIGSNIRPSNMNLFKPIAVGSLAVNRPLISPPMLKYNNLNMANWNNLGNGESRSSSQSSGFVSQRPFNTSSPNNSVCSDFDYASLFSEPLMGTSKFSDFGSKKFRTSKTFSEPS